LRRLAAMGVQPGGPSAGTPKPEQNEVSPGSDSSPPRRFVEKFQKRRITQNNQNKDINSSYIAYH